MILLISWSARAQECVEALQEATSESVQAAPTLRQAVALLRTQDYSAVVIDQGMMDADPEASETILQHLGSASPVYVNFAISGIQRVVRELRAALYRRKREVLVAQQAAEDALRNQLKGSVTAMLLSCEMALKVPDLPPPAQVKLHAVYELAQEMRSKLGPEAMA